MSETHDDAARKGRTPPKADARAAAAAAVDQLVGPPRPPRWWGVLLGLLAAGAGLAAGQLIADFDTELHNPVLSVGDRVIDKVPKWMKNFAIENFGTSDKTVLLWTISIIVAIAAAIVGIAVLRGRIRVGLIAAAVFGVLGASAGAAGRNTSSAGVLPSLFAAGTAAGVLWYGFRLTHPKPVRRPVNPRTATRAVPIGPPPVDRRRFLTITGAIAATAGAVVLLGEKLQSKTRSVDDQVKDVLGAGDTTGTTLQPGQLPRPLEPAQPLPAAPTDPAALAANDGLSALITPVGDFYRIDTALTFPQLDIATWKLKITGMVDKELTFSYTDLLARELIERDITLSCVSNEVGGDLVGNARWVGCRLDDLLQEAGIHADADQIMGVSDDGFTAGFPVETLDGRDAMIALAMNGEVLPVKNGFPARIVVPGLYGYVSAVKWLSEIRLTRFDQEEGYWVGWRGWSKLGPIKTQSRIDRPGGSITAGRTPIAGVAWAPDRGISTVEVQVDDGDWMVATLGPTLGKNAWLQWWVDWDATAGKHQIRVRATDGNGDTQTEERTRVDPDGASGWHTVRVTVKG